MLVWLKNKSLSIMDLSFVNLGLCGYISSEYRSIKAMAESKSNIAALLK